MENSFSQIDRKTMKNQTWVAPLSMMKPPKIHRLNTETRRQWKKGSNPRKMVKIDYSQEKNKTRDYLLNLPLNLVPSMS